MASWGYASGAVGSVAPFVARSFGLDDTGMATLGAWLGLSAIGALALGGAVDRLGRRRVLLVCCATLPAACGVASLADGPVGYLVALLVAQAAGGTLAATVAVMLAEGLATDERADGQGRAGTAFAVASAIPLLVVFLRADDTEPWRLVWALGALPLLAWPWLRRGIDESARWRAASKRGEARAARLSDVFRGPHRERATRVIAAVVGVSAVEVATRAWLFYHPIQALALDTRSVTIVLVICGGIGLVGFRLGARLSNRFGRRYAFAISALTTVAGTIGYYGVTTWLADPTHRLICLAASLLVLATSGNAATVAFRSVATELMPTRMRGAIGGWLAVGTALGWLLSMSTIAWWSPILGGIGPALSIFALVVMPVACTALTSLPETAGLDLDVAAGEEVKSPA